MRRPDDDELLAWIIGTLALMAMVMALSGCAASAYPTEASESFTSVEMALVDQTARFADQLGVEVRGKITSVMRADIASLNPLGWYADGVAYYYRPRVAASIRLVPTPGFETPANIAAHEVAHALYYMHDAQHWCCTKHMGASPTYAPPVVGLVCEGVATRCLTNR